jgi:hypothetical protein
MVFWRAAIEVLPHGLSSARLSIPLLLFWSVYIVPGNCETAIPNHHRLNDFPFGILVGSMADRGKQNQQSHSRNIAMCRRCKSSPVSEYAQIESTGAQNCPIAGPKNSKHVRSAQNVGHFGWSYFAEGVAQIECGRVTAVVIPLLIISSASPKPLSTLRVHTSLVFQQISPVFFLLYGVP